MSVFLSARFHLRLIASSATNRLRPAHVNRCDISPLLLHNYYGASYFRALRGAHWCTGIAFHLMAGRLENPNFSRQRRLSIAPAQLPGDYY